MKWTNGIYILLAAVLGLGLMLEMRVFAQDKNPCTEDIAKFCQGIKSDMRSILACLEEHENELSDACRDYEVKMEGMRAERREVVRQQRAIFLTCKDDILNFCKDVDPIKGGFINCLNEHEKELSAPCRESINTARGEQSRGK